MIIEIHGNEVGKDATTVLMSTVKQLAEGNPASDQIRDSLRSPENLPLGNGMTIDELNKDHSSVTREREERK